MNRLVVKLFAVATLAIGCFVVLHPTKLYAMAACEWSRTYYSNSTFSTQVGYYEQDCYGRISTGSTSSYYEFENIDACNGTCDVGGFRCSNGIITWAWGEYQVGLSCPTF